MTERVLRLEGGRNFRDMGGYPTTDGRRLKWKRLFRSGGMAGLTEADYQRLAGLGVRAIIDLRTTREREAHPHDWARMRAGDYWARDYHMSFGDLRAIIASEAAGPAARAAMVEAYRALPFEQAPGYRELFRRLGQGDVPLVFNCSAGKDRTGVAAALVLSALGADQDVILEDYLLTNTAYDWRTAHADPLNPISNLPIETAEAVLGVDADYLHAALAEIAQAHGSVGGYLEAGLGVDRGALDRIRAELLE